MRRLALFAAAALCGCDLTVTGPYDGLETARVDFCWSDHPNWVAVKNTDRNWRPIVVSQQRYPLPITDKVILTFGRYVEGQSSEVTVMMVTATELKQAKCGGGSLIGLKTLYANVSGFDSTQVVRAAMAAAVGQTDPSYRSGSPGQVRISGVQEGPTDLAAWVMQSNRPKYLIHRDVSAPNGSLIAPLDFSAGVLTDRFPVTLAGATDASVYTQWLSGDGTSIDLGVSTVTGGAGTWIGMPATVVAAGDLHRVSGVSTDGRRSTTYTSSLGTTALTFGSALSAPTITTVDTSLGLRLRATFASQAEYPAFAVATFAQGASSQFRYTVVVSAGYLDGRPAQWDLEIPILPFTAPVGLLKPADPYTWQVEAWDATPAFFFGNRGAVDGTTVKCAMAASSPSLFARGCRTPLQFRATPTPETNP